ncbi:Metallo-dependent phosphatase [Aureobasidium subglaciale]|nr:Metallo-dependent phosphatase [Aureobasidium subglaciale]
MTPSALYAHPVVTDLTVCFFSLEGIPFTCVPDPQTWHRIEKELYLYTSQQTAWLYVALANEDDFSAEDLFVADIGVGEAPPNSSSSSQWESRPGGIWVLRRKFSAKNDRPVTEVDVLFGPDAVDPRPQWTLIGSSLQLDGQSMVLDVKLTVLFGRARPILGARAVLRVREDHRFKIVQISDTHMGTGVGVCKDAIDADGNNLPQSGADPLTVDFIAKILDLEKPNLVILTGDQLHHDTSDSQTALFKVVAPIIERSVPFAAVFGNHDSEGTAQMSILRTLPFNLCESGPEDVEGIGNFRLEILAPAPSNFSLSTLYLLDSHGQISSKIQNPDYDPIKQSQIDWFTRSAQGSRSMRERRDDVSHVHLSLAFQHIPLPEFADSRLRIRNGHRGEPSEEPSLNSHFYDALVKEGISAFGCGHDHVNDFCALLPQRTLQNGRNPAQPGPWLCYAGGGGFGGYCSYGTSRFHRRMRVWELDTSTGSLTTWKRVEYAMDRVDEIVLVDNGIVVDDHGEEY